jgi:hypothetical protein
MYFVMVAPTVAARREIAGKLEFPKDRSGGSAGDADLVREVGDAHRWVVRDDLKHVRVVRYESEKVVSVTGS